MALKNVTPYFGAKRWSLGGSSGTKPKTASGSFLSQAGVFLSSSLLSFFCLLSALYLCLCLCLCLKPAPAQIRQDGTWLAAEAFLAFQFETSTKRPVSFIQAPPFSQRSDGLISFLPSLTCYIRLSFDAFILSFLPPTHTCGTIDRALAVVRSFQARSRPTHR